MAQINCCLKKCVICEWSIVNSDVCEDCKEILVENYLNGVNEKPHEIKEKANEKREIKRQKNFQEYMEYLKNGTIWIS